jgi:hypothetical protein
MNEEHAAVDWRFCIFDSSFIIHRSSFLPAASNRQGAEDWLQEAADFRRLT